MIFVRKRNNTSVPTQCTNYFTEDRISHVSYSEQCHVIC